MAASPESSNPFGVRTGIHAYRVFDIAIVDLALALLAIWIFARFFDLPLWKVTVIGLLIGILAHRVFNVRTTVDVLLFPDEACK